MKALLTALVAAFVVAAGAAASNPAATVTIRHQMRGCHAWSVNGNAFKAAHAAALHRGQAILFSNFDVMPQQLVQKSGPAKIRLPFAGMMNRAHTSIAALFPKAGAYTFTTKAGEDYMPMKTIGADNVLRLTVTVS
jgi:hypothetical protein